MKSSILIIGAIIIALVAGAGGFVAGMAMTQTPPNATLLVQPGAQDSLNANGQNGAPPAMPQNGMAQANGTRTNGQIKSVSGDTIEISTADSVVTVKVNAQTVITKNDVGVVSDLQVGDAITVYSLDSGDNPTASRIQLQSADLPLFQGAPRQGEAPPPQLAQ